MKLLKSIAIASLASMFALSTAQANTQKSTAKTQTKQQQSKKQTNTKTTKQATKPAAKQTANNKNTQKKSSTAKKAAGVAAAAAAPAVLSQDQALKLFNESFGIRLLGYKVDNNSAGKPHLFLKYELTNKGKKDIKAVQFIGAFTHNNQIVYAQEIPLTFNNLLKVKDKTTVDMAIPFENVPENARQLFLASNAQLGVVSGAKTLVFSDNTGIQLK